MIEIIVLSVVQGITEFIPVSSSLHLLIFGELFQNSGKLNLLIFTSMHLGSLFGVATFLLTDTKMEIKKVHLKQLFFLILFVTIPSVLIGFFLYYFVSENLTINNIVISSTFFFGVLLFVADKYAQTTKSMKHLTLFDILFIGFFQCFSLIPGASRSATTIISSRFLGIDRKTSIIISTLLSFPVIIGAFTLSLIKTDFGNLDHIPLKKEILPSIIFSFVSSYIALKIFFKYSSIKGFGGFAIYRILLAAILLFK